MPREHSDPARPATTADPALDRGPQTQWEDAPWGASGAIPQRGENFGRYVILHELGSGGMGVVFAAYDPELDRRVALKVLGDTAADERGRARLLREAQTMARISHPNVITVHDVGTVGGQLFIAMELVEGADLRKWLKHDQRPPEVVLDALLQAGRGLAAAHDEGLIHRDLKPANILVGDDGLVRVLDFGLALRVGPGEEQMDREGDLGDESGTSLASSNSNSHSESLTRTGAIAGTPAYMSPEQHARADLDAKSDQFSFCVTAFEALFGERPFSGGNRMALMLAATQGDHRPIPKPSPVAPHVSAAILRGLSPAPSDRFPDMRALLAALTPTGRNPKALVTAVAVLGTGVAVAWGVTSAPDEPPCGGIEALAQQTWNADRARTLAASFERANVPYAEESLAFTRAELDAYVADWVRSRTDACEGSRVRRDQSEALLDRRVACLERRRSALHVALEVLTDAEAGPDGVQHASELVAGLEPIAQCDDLDALGGSQAQPPPEADKQAVAAAETLLARGRSLTAVSRPDQSLRPLREATEAAERIGYDPLTARALSELGHAQTFEHKQEEASANLHRAAMIATRLGDARLLATTWIRLGRLLGEGTSKNEEGLRWLDYAEAALHKEKTPDPGIASDLALGRASLLSDLGRIDEALAVLDAAEATRLPGEEPTIAELFLRGNLLTYAARFDDAAAVFFTVRERVESQLGADHPLMGIAANGLGVTEFSKGNLAGAEAQFQTAYEIQLAAFGEDYPDLLFSIGNVGELKRMRGDYQGALATFAVVERLVGRAFPPRHREVGTTNHNIATIHREAGDPAASLPRYEIALDVRTEVHGETHPYVGNTLTGKGLALLDLGRDQEALALLERAKTIRDESGGPPRKIADTEFALARALQRVGAQRPDEQRSDEQRSGEQRPGEQRPGEQRSGEQRPGEQRPGGHATRARTLAQGARDRLAKLDADEVAAQQRAEIETWLRTLDAPDDASATPTPE